MRPSLHKCCGNCRGRHGFDDQAVRLAGDGHVVQLQKLLLDRLQALFVGVKERARQRIDQHAPAAVIELEIAAAGRIDVGNELFVTGCDVLRQLPVVGIVLSGVLLRKRHDHLLDELGRCRDRELRNAVFILQHLDELEVLHKRVRIEQPLPVR